MFWFLFGVMLLCAAFVVAMPLYRGQRRISGLLAGAVLFVVVGSAALYSKLGSPNLDPVRQTAGVPDVEQMVAALAARLQENPDDLPGWKMLGRSYLQLGNAPAAVRAFEKAVEMESAGNGQTLAELGEAVLMNDGTTLNGRAGQLFENSLALAPTNAKALFYSGLAAIERGDNEQAATRWEALLATAPPPEIAETLRQRIAELRGVPAPVASNVADPAVVTARVSLGTAASAANLPAGSTVFIIARDPDQPTPPIAAVRRSLDDLPAEILIGDKDAMMAGRLPSAFERLEIVARVSLSGQPLQQPGDWYGSQVAANGDTFDIVIDQQVR